MAVARWEEARRLKAGSQRLAAVTLAARSNVPAEGSQMVADTIASRPQAAIQADKPEPELSSSKHARIAAKDSRRTLPHANTASDRKVRGFSLSEYVGDTTGQMRAFPRVTLRRRRFTTRPHTETET